MRGNASGVDDFQSVHGQKMFQAGECVVAKVLVVNGVVLKSFEQSQEIVGLGNKDPIVAKELQNGVHNFVNIFDVRENIGCSDDFRLAMLRDCPSSRSAIEERDVGCDTPSICQGSRVSGFDSENPMSAVLEVTQQRAIIRADIDHKVLGGQRVKALHFPVELRKVFAQDFGCATRVRVGRGKQNSWVNDQSQLHQLALAAAQ